MTPPPANRNRRHGRTTRYIAIVETSWVEKVDGLSDWLRCVAFAAAAVSRPWDAVQTSLPQSARGIMTIWIRLERLCRKNPD